MISCNSSLEGYNYLRVGEDWTLWFPFSRSLPAPMIRFPVIFSPVIHGFFLMHMFDVFPVNYCPWLSIPLTCSWLASPLSSITLMQEHSSIHFCVPVYTIGKNLSRWWCPVHSERALILSRIYSLYCLKSGALLYQPWSLLIWKTLHYGPLVYD